MSELLITEQAGLRSLHFGSDWVQGQMRIRRPDELVLAYTQEMCAGLLFVPEPARIWIAGLGVGALPRFALKHWSQSMQVMRICEIRADVLALAETEFPLFRAQDPDPRVHLIHADAAKDIAIQPRGQIDWIWVDAYDHRGQVGQLESARFFLAAAEALSPHGVLVANLWSNVPRFPLTLQRLARAFDSRVWLLPSEHTENMTTIALGPGVAAPNAQVLRERASRLTSSYRLPFKAWTKRLRTLTEFRQPTTVQAAAFHP